MATTRNATTHWEGSLMDGSGRVTLESSGIGTFDVNWPSRAESANGKTSPEELIAAAHSSCFSMALSHGLAQAGPPPTSLDTSAAVTFQPGEGITGLVRLRSGSVAAEVIRHAHCPVVLFRPPRLEHADELASAGAGTTTANR